ncbi:MAG: hypothetical protein WA101_01845 [Minisyncoccia bacterium]
MEGQFNLNLVFSEPEKTEEKIIEKDSKRRTRSDIIIESRSLKKDVIDSIVYKNGEYYIEGKLADDWISQDRDLHGKDSDYGKN